MRMIIEAHLVDNEGCTERVQVCAIDRELTPDPLGMSLAEGKALLAAAQQQLVNGQCEGIVLAHAQCEECDAKLGVKGWHQRQIRTVFGLVSVQSPRVRYCRCAGRQGHLQSTHSGGAHQHDTGARIPSGVVGRASFLRDGDCTVERGPSHCRHHFSKWRKATNACRRRRARKGR